MLVRWYVAYALSYRDIEELAAEQGFWLATVVISDRLHFVEK